MPSTTFAYTRPHLSDFFYGSGIACDAFGLPGVFLSPMDDGTPTPEEKAAADKKAADDKAEAERLADESRSKPKLFTEDDMKRIVQERLAQEKKQSEKRIEEEKRATEEAKLKEQGEYKILNEQKEAELQQLKAEIAQRDREAIRARVAASVFSDSKMAHELAPRLVGETEEELTADAKRLLKLIPANIDTRLGNHGDNSNGKNSEITEQQRQNDQNAFARSF